MYIKTIFSAWVVLALLSGAQIAHSEKKDDTLVVSVQREIRNLDRLYTTKREGLILAQLIDDGLFYVDPETLKFVTLAAKEYEFVDEKTLDIVIRDGVKFHDGSPLTAEDVVYTYKWALNKKSRIRIGTRIQRWMKSVEKIGPMKVRFKLKKPYSMVLRDMAVSIYLRKKGSCHAQGKRNRNALRYAHNGLGPYKVVGFIPREKVVLERYEGYYPNSLKGRPSIKRLVIRTTKDLGAQLVELLKENVQLIYDVPYNIAQSIRKISNSMYRAGPSMRVGFLIMDAAGVTGKDSPFIKFEVRRAMNHAINRELIVKNIVRGTSKAIHSACHPVQFGCPQDARKCAYDPGKAKKLLEKAGYPNGFEVDMWAYRDRAVAEAIVADLTKVGIRAKLRYVKLSTILSARRSLAIRLFFGSWGSGDTADSSMIAGPHFSPTSDRNMSGDKEVAKYIIAGESTLDPHMRLEAYKKGFGLIAERAYWVPLYSHTQYYLVSPELNFQPPRDGLLRLFLAKWK